LLSEFKPFFDLTSMAADIKGQLVEWTTGQLMKQDTELIKNSVIMWQSDCNRLRKKFDEEDKSEASDVAIEQRAIVDEF